MFSLGEKMGSEEELGQPPKWGRWERALVRVSLTVGTGPAWLLHDPARANSD